MAPKISDIMKRRTARRRRVGFGAFLAVILIFVALALVRKASAVRELGRKRSSGGAAMCGRFRMQGGSTVLGALSAAPWIIIGILIAGIGFLLWYRKPAAAAAVPAAAPSQPVVIIAQPSASQKELPITPSRDPAYPLRRVPGPYQQMGTLIRESDTGGDPTVLPLIGRPSETNANRWNYYTSTDGGKTHLMRLKVSNRGRDCQEDVGCEEIATGDDVNVAGYGETAFKAEVYRYERPTRLPV